MKGKRQSLEDAIITLKMLLASDEAVEDDFQSWFEERPIIFEALGYKRFLPKPILTTTKGNRIPDFLVQRRDDLWEVFDLKRPDTKILKDRERRRTFYASLEEYYQQCREYADYFVEEVNRADFFDRFGVKVQSAVPSTIVAGRNRGFDRPEAFKILFGRGMKVKIVTYDDVLDHLELYRLSTLGDYEGVRGISIHLVFIAHQPQGSPDNYLLDIGHDEGRNRISIYVRQGSLHFRFVSSDGLTNEFRITPDSSTFGFDELTYLVLEIGFGADASIVSMQINGVYQSLNYLDGLRIEFRPDLVPVVLGSDLRGNAEANFTSIAYIMAKETLGLETRFKVQSDLYERYWKPWLQYKNLPPRSEFIGHKYLYTSNHPNFPNPGQTSDLIQPVAEFQPRLIFGTPGDDQPRPKLPTPNE